MVVALRCRLGLIAALVCVSTVASATPRLIPLGPPASEVGFRVYGMGLLPIDAHFARFTGWLIYDSDALTPCRVQLQVEVASLTADDTSVRDTIIGPEFM